MNKKNKYTLILFLILIFSKCSNDNSVPSAFKQFNSIRTTINVDSNCKYSLSKKQAIVSFSNSWNNNIVASVNNNVIFEEHILTEPSTATTNKSFTVYKSNDSIDLLTIFIVDEKKVFNVKIDYTHQYIKIYKVSDSVKLLMTNCKTLVY